MSQLWIKQGNKTGNEIYRYINKTGIGTKKLSTKITSTLPTDSDHPTTVAVFDRDRNSTSKYEPNTKDLKSNSWQFHQSNVKQKIDHRLQTTKQELTERFDKWYEFYGEWSHMNEIRHAQDKVIKIHDDLQKSQQRRIVLMQELDGIRKELQTIHDELSNCDRRDARRPILTKQEFDLYQRESDKKLEFDREDEMERNLFTHLTAAIKYTQQKEKVYANTMRNFSYLASIGGAFVGIIGTVISYHYRQKTIDSLTTKHQGELERISGQLNVLGLEFSSLLEKVQTPPTPPSQPIVENKIAEQDNSNWLWYYTKRGFWNTWYYTKWILRIKQE